MSLDFYHFPKPELPNSKAIIIKDFYFLLLLSEPEFMGLKDLLDVVLQLSPINKIPARTVISIVRPLNAVFNIYST